MRANFPDLYPIEDIWDQKKELLFPQWKVLLRARKRMKNQVKINITEVWRYDTIFVKAKHIYED